MSVFRTFSAPFKLFVATRGDALRACPWLSYPAPLALPIALAHSAFGAADRAGSFRLWRCRSRWLIPPLGAADRAGSFRLWRCRSRWLIPPLALPIALAHSAFGRCRSRWLIPPLALPIALAHSAFGAADRAGLFRAFGAVHRPRSFRFGAGISDSKPSHALLCCDSSSVQLPDNLVHDLVDVQSSYRRLVLKPLR